MKYQTHSSLDFESDRRAEITRLSKWTTQAEIICLDASNHQIFQGLRGFSMNRFTIELCIAYLLRP